VAFHGTSRAETHKSGSLGGNKHWVETKITPPSLIFADRETVTCPQEQKRGPKQKQISHQTPPLACSEEEEG